MKKPAMNGPMTVKKPTKALAAKEAGPVTVSKKGAVKPKKK